MSEDIVATAQLAVQKGLKDTYLNGHSAGLGASVLKVN